MCATRTAVTLVATLAVAASACSSEPPSGSTSTATGAPDAVPAGACDTGALGDQPLLAAVPDTPLSASYAKDASLPQAANCEGMRSFISTPQPGFDLQSYCFYGYLQDDTATTIAFATVAQDLDTSLGASPKVLMEETGQIINPGDGALVGGVVGTVDQSAAVSATSNPFSLRTQTMAAGQVPSYVDIRVVEGQLGQPGAIIQLTSQVPSTAMASPTVSAAPLQVSLQLKDVAGVGQWGYGPSGFFPQWITPSQREAITSRHGGSVGAYLDAGTDTMNDQGSYYYSSPVVEVQRFTITQGGRVIASGTKGELLVDYVTQSFDAPAVAIVTGGVAWTEFSTLLEGGTTMKVGQVTQSSVGTLPYAMSLSTGGKRLPNGSIDAQRWDIDGVAFTPDASATWTSPRSNQTYTTRYTVKLSGDDPSMDGELTYEALYDDQEVSIGGRTVYEGLYKVQGTIGGKAVSGQAWAEVQPTGKL